MRKGLRRLRGALGSGVTWGIAWGASGLGIGALSLLPWHPFGAFMKVMDAPLPAMAIPGFFGGVFFSGVLAVAAGRRSFRELSLPRFALYGAIGGALLTLFPFLLVALGLANTEGSPHSAGFAIAAVGPVFVTLSALSAAGSLWLARTREDAAAGEGGEEAIRLLGAEQGSRLEANRFRNAESVRRPRA